MDDNFITLDDITVPDTLTSHRLDFDLKLNPDVSARLYTYMRGLREGSDLNIVSGICTDIAPEKILSDFDALFESKKSALNSRLLSLELDSRDKFGPRSIQKPWKDRISDINSYFNAEPLKHHLKNINYSNVTLRPKSLINCVDLLKNDTNSGLPFFRQKGVIKQKLRDLINNNNFSSILSRKDPAILFTRTQEGNKTRNVWGYPVADTLFEMQYYYPLLDYQRKQNWRSALLGPNFTDDHVSSMMYKALNNNNLTLVSIDFSAFDASVHPDITTSCFNIIKSMFQPKYHSDIDYIRDRFINIGILTPDGVISGRHGVPSGSTFTNEIDSLAQYIISLSSGIRIFSSQIQGDDGLYLIDSKDVDQFISTFENYGLKVNKDKSIISNNHCTYLRCLYDADYKVDGVFRGIYPIYRALGRICYQERFVDFLKYGISGKDYYSIRTISILENCKYHPLFEEFVKFVYSRDKYLLQFSRDSLSKYKRLQKEIFGFDSTLNPRPGDDISGLSSFKTISILNKLA